MRAFLAVLLVVAASSVASAEPVRRVVDVPVPKDVLRDKTVVRTLFLNRCTGGCTVHAGTVNDAANDDTSILGATGDFNISEFDAGDANWAAVVACVQQVYSPYNIKIVDTRPTGIVFNETIVAGRSEEAGQTGDTLGIAPLAGDCSPLTDQIAFSFANSHGPTGFVDNLCWTVSQESAHIYGLDHENQFTDPTAPTPVRPDTGKKSACNDPMTYLTDCGGQKFFRDIAAQCGEFGGPRDCKCSKTQNSYAKMIGLFGPSTPTTTPPTVSIMQPGAGASVGQGESVVALAGAQRGVHKLELYLNGALWAESLGAPFGETGQATTTYGIQFPDTVPDGEIDIVVRAYDDLGVTTDSATVHVKKGADCTDKSSCLDHQSCTAGACVFDPPVGELGDACTFAQECVSQHCEVASGTAKTCTSECVAGDPTTCADGFTCRAIADNGDSAGLCAVAPDAGGCCSAGGNAGAAGASLLAAGVAGVLFRRRRRRATQAA